jgi:hypothetical protein
MRRPLVWGLLFAGALTGRLCHLELLWVEECYPAAAAIQILHGKIPYRDFWFDKPPLAPLVYLLWGAWGGWPLRLAGALYVAAAGWLLYRFASKKWGEREGMLAAGLCVFFLTFGVPSAVMALAPDLLMLVPHVAAVYLSWRGRPLAAGLAAGVAVLLNTKGLFVLVACLLFSPRAWRRVAAGFALPNLVMLGGLGATGALPGYLEQVWRWGWLYSRDTFVASPIVEGLKRTANWAGFHAVLVVGAVVCFRRGHDPEARRFALWMLIALATVAAGWRFFPRYYFHLLPVMVLLGARGLALLERRATVAALALLLVPLVRFGPRYVVLASDLIAGREHAWADAAMYQSSRRAARLIREHARPADTLLVWGYRPDIFVETRLAAGTPFLDSQPLTGVIADRHLVDARPSAPGLARANRLRLTAMSPTFVVDGLGPYNPGLAMAQFSELDGWLGRYTELAREPGAVIYRLKNSPGL